MTEPTNSFIDTRIGQFVRLPVDRLPFADEDHIYKAVPRKFPGCALAIKSPATAMAYIKDQLPNIVAYVERFRRQETLLSKPDAGTYTVHLPCVNFALRILMRFIRLVLQTEDLDLVFERGLRKLEKLFSHGDTLCGYVDGSRENNVEYIELYYDVLPELIKRCQSILDACDEAAKDIKAADDDKASGDKNNKAAGNLGPGKA